MNLFHIHSHYVLTTTIYIQAYTHWCLLHCCYTCSHVHLHIIGCNANGCSGIDSNTRNTIGGNKCLITPRKVDALCKKQIANIVSGYSRHVLAITKSGKIYSWGCNGSDQLGHGSNTPSPNPNPTTIAKLDQFQVKQVACGSKHSMALTTDGKVLYVLVNTYFQI